MKILLDTNVVLDLLLAREPFHQDALKLFNKIEKKELEGYLCAITVTTIHYLISKHADKNRAEQGIALLLELFQVAPVTREVLEAAIMMRYNDFEDAVLCKAGQLAGVDAIVTRNEKDFKKAQLDIYSPSAMLVYKREH